MSVSIDLLCKIPKPIAVGDGVFKARSAWGLLHTGVITTLVTDKECAGHVITEGL